MTTHVASLGCTGQVSVYYTVCNRQEAEPDRPAHTRVERRNRVYIRQSSPLSKRSCSHIAPIRVHKTDIISSLALPAPTTTLPPRPPDTPSQPPHTTEDQSDWREDDPQRSAQGAEEVERGEQTPQPEEQFTDQQGVFAGDGQRECGRW